MNKERLLKLAEHLESGKLGHDVFNFSVVNGDADGCQLYANGCGFCGCAVGELPFAFPGDWVFEKGWPMLKNVTGSMQGATYFFGISVDTYNHLFVPEWQDPERFGGVQLGFEATAGQVASNIRAFVQKMEQQKDSV